MRFVIVIAVLAAAAGCKKTEETPPTGQTYAPPESQPITGGEIELGQKACTGYVAQVCKCAESKPELKEECQMATARPQAFEMNTRAALATGDATTKDRKILVANARKIMSSCIQDSAALMKKGCPMVEAPPPAGTAPATSTGTVPAPAATSTPPSTGAAPAPAPAR